MPLRLLLLLVALSVALPGCTGGGSAPATQGAAGTSSPEAASGSVLAIPTCEEDEFCGEEALVYGVLTFDGQGCVWISGGDPARGRSVVWPHGFSARSAESGLELLGPDGEVVAREGDILKMGGGHYQVDHSHCAPGAEGAVWFARTVTVIDRIPE
ncbi:hypothetical protein [Euzebya rosea]|uniref:hypothetical protein n=1 Tax=Euzebya rosea TaxID=2052804 RepID=UPI000D3E41CD|nr:hypothetical protein [Euzebya rosea]